MMLQTTVATVQPSERGTMMAEDPASPAGGATDLSDAFREDRLDV
jgi:hypothetical protein